MLVGAIFIDINKAFDRVWHKGLLFRLHELCLPNYLGGWIKDYLFSRTFQVKVDGKLSEVKQIKAGVPQGSILGPLLFNIYFNSVADTILSNKAASLALYADDIGIWVASPYLKIITKHLQSILDCIFLWMSKWRMVVSTEKSVVSLFNRGCKKISDRLVVSYNGTRLPSESYPKFLGITLDPGLRMSRNTEIVLTRANRRINLLKKLSGKNWGVKPLLILITYKVLIRSIIDYSILTVPTLSVTSLNKLEVIQRKAIRIAFCWPADSSSVALLNISNLTSIEERAILLCDKFFRKAILQNNFTVIREINNYLVHREVNEGAISNSKHIHKTLFGTLLTNKMSDAHNYLLSSQLNQNT